MEGSDCSEESVFSPDKSYKQEEGEIAWEGGEEFTVDPGVLEHEGLEGFHLQDKWCNQLISSYKHLQPTSKLGESKRRCLMAD